MTKTIKARFPQKLRPDILAQNSSSEPTYYPQMQLNIWICIRARLIHSAVIATRRFPGEPDYDDWSSPSSG